MKGRIFQWLLLAGALAAIVAVAIAQHPRGGVSTYSSYDTGANGYRALYEVLAREKIPVQRLESRLAFLPRETGVLILTDTQPESSAGAEYLPLSRNEVRQVKAFAKRGRALLFAPSGSTLAVSMGKAALRLDPAAYTNAALARTPKNAATVYQLVAGRGTVLFDERLHGYIEDRSFWEALPPAVHVAVWIVLSILVLILIEQNVRTVPPVRSEVPFDRDSSSYIRSMAVMLRRGRAGRTAIARFSEDAARLTSRSGPSANARRLLDELQNLVHNRGSDIDVLRAAKLYAAIRKEL